MCPDAHLALRGYLKLRFAVIFLLPVGRERSVTVWEIRARGMGAVPGVLLATGSGLTGVGRSVGGMAVIGGVERIVCGRAKDFSSS